jgi:hypothetical protein
MLTKKRTLLLLLVALLVGGIFAELRTNQIRRWIDDFLYDSKNHYLPCAKLPTESEVRRVVEQHQEAVQKIEQLNPGFVDVRIDSSTCPGKADIVIVYPSHEDRLAIEDIIGGERFFGIPYRLRNY